MNAPPFPPFPANPKVGQSFGTWAWNGSQWVGGNSPGVRVVRQVFTASGPYMPSPGLVTADVECLGGGGGGGAAYTTALPSTFVILSAGGGGSGGYSRRALAASLVIGGVSVTVGYAGQAGQSGGSGGNPAQYGGDGGPTNFGGMCIALGGFGGGAMNIGIGAPFAGAGAAIGDGDFGFPGACGQPGAWQEFTALTSFSASSPLGGQIFGGTTSALAGAVQGVAGPSALPNTGAGGGGALINQMATGSELLGGAGGSGICIVTEYCWLEADGCAPGARVSLDWCG